MRIKMKPEQLKNIIPLYLGQKVEYLDDDINGNFHPWTSAIDKVSADGEIDLNDGTVLSDLGGFGESAFLLLRPLSSMTEEEVKGLCEVMDVRFSTLFVNKSGFDLATSEFKVSVWDDGDMIIEDGDFLPVAFIPHLCALGFDCFNLIGLGIAKDVTKIKQ